MLHIQNGSFFLSFSHDWPVQGSDKLFVKRVRLLLNGTDIDGYDTRSPEPDVYNEFFFRYHMICGDIMGMRAAGMSTTDFDDNAFIGEQIKKSKIVKSKIKKTKLYSTQ